ncbi:retrovirus-related pol polyprotein from transposon TNT 1-94, partial [Tanacetum coccineum]
MSFIKKIENLNEVRVKELRSDNGTEGISPDISYLHVFGCPVHIHNYRDHLEKFDEKADDGFFLGYSPVAKAFRVFNIRRQEMEEIEFFISEDPPEFTKADTHPTINKPDKAESADHLDSVELQIPVSHDRWSRENHIELVNIIGEPLAGITTRSKIRDSNVASASECLYVNFLFEMEPKKLIEAIEEEGWIIAMQEELKQFKRNKVWTLVPKLHGKTIIGTKWISKNNMDENGIVIKNKARLVAHGYNQQEEIDYEETFALVSRSEAIRIFLAYAAYMGFMVYQMDVMSAFLNGKISKEVYVQKPLGFESSEFPNHVCKLDKAFYGLKQALKAWYQANPKESYIVAVKRIFRYLKGTLNLGLWYPKGPGFNLKADSDSDYAGSNLDRKSTSRGCQILGGKLVFLWIKSQLAGYDVLYDKVSIFCDNTSAIAISNNPVLHSRMGQNILTSAEPSFTRLVAEMGMLNIEKQATEELVVIVDPLQSIETSESAEVAEEQSLEIPTVAQLLDEVNKAAQETPESPYDTQSEIKVVKSFFTSHLSRVQDQTMNDYEESTGIQEDSDSDLQSMPDDDLRSISGFEADNSDDTHDNEVSHSSHTSQDDIASAEHLSIPDHLDHICEEVSYLHSRLGNMESSIVQTVSDEIKSSLPAIITNALKEQLPGIFSATLKDCLPLIVKESLQTHNPAVSEQFAETQAQLNKKVVKQLNRQFNISYVAESNRFVTLKKELSKVIKSEVAKKVQVVGLEGVREDLQSQTKHISKYSSSFQNMQTQLQDVKDLLESTVIIDEIAEGEKKLKDKNAIPAPTQGEHQTAENITPPKTQGELAYN